MNAKSISNKSHMIAKELEERYDRARSAWSRGVILYADELLDNVWDEVNISGEITEVQLLNGVPTWQKYSVGGCSLIYDEDICHRLCTPSEIKRKRGGRLPPNSHETWLDVQSRALYQAARLIMEIKEECDTMGTRRDYQVSVKN